jgi:hypothetical protein
MDKYTCNTLRSKVTDRNDLRMIIEYNVKYNKNIKKTDLQSKMCDMFAKEQRQVYEIIDVHSELIKPSSINPLYAFSKEYRSNDKQQEV